VKAHVNVSDRGGAVIIVLDSLCVIGTNENLVIKVRKSVSRGHIDAVNMKIDECMSNHSNNLYLVHELASKLKFPGVLGNKNKNILSFSLYWPAFVTALDNPYESESRRTLQDWCPGHWSWWIKTAGDPERVSPHWQRIKATMAEGFKGIRMDIRDLSKEKQDFVVFSHNGVSCTYLACLKKLSWRPAVIFGSAQDGI